MSWKQVLLVIVSVSAFLLVVSLPTTLTSPPLTSEVGIRSANASSDSLRLEIASVLTSIDSVHLSRLYKFDSLRAVGDTVGMCNKILANWFSTQEDIAYGPAGIFSNSYGPDSSDLAGLTKASARFLKYNCGPAMSTVDAVDERYRSYRDAIRVAFLLRL